MKDERCICKCFSHYKLRGTTQLEKATQNEAISTRDTNTRKTDEFSFNLINNALQF